jgi:hypothetical protein
MIANIGPSDFNAEESLSTLKYAYGAKSIKNKPKINEDPKDAAIRQFTDEIEFLKAQLSNMNSGNGQELDPKTLMLLMGNKGDDKMAEMLAKRQEELHRQKEDLNNKKKEIEEMRQLRLKNGENADKVELEFNQMENELEKRQAAIDQENIQKAQLLDNLSKLEEQMVVGSKETEKLKMKKQELENYKLTIKGDIESYDAVEKVLRKEEENKEILDKKNKNLQSQLNQLDKEINQKNIELTLIGTKINEFEANAKEDKELILKEIEDLNLELMSHERIIKSLIPHNVEQVLSSLVQWNEETETWDLVKNQKIAPRYERPFSIYPVRKPIARSKAGECQYQNSMLKSKGKGLVFWKDHQMNANNVLSNDGYLNNQLAQMNPSELEAQVISTKELEELELQTREKEEKELEEAKRKAGTHAKPEKKEEVKPVQLKKEPAKKGPVKNAVMDEESFPEARGNRTKGRF